MSTECYHICDLYQLKLTVNRKVVLLDTDCKYNTHTTWYILVYFLSCIISDYHMIDLGIKTVLIHMDLVFFSGIHRSTILQVGITQKI